MDIARRNSLKRIVRCSQIMGRSESDDLSAAQIMYPVMQCADIFFLKVGGRGTRGGLGWWGGLALRTGLEA
jgi:tyrosyl-tRNA synthetase